MTYRVFFGFNLVIELVDMYVHKATAFRIFYMNDYQTMRTTDSLCTGDCR